MITKVSTVYRSGFTLIEIIMVIAAIGILAAITITSVLAFNTKARNAIDTSNVATLNKATTIYSLTEGISSQDIFDGLISDSAKIQLLIDKGYLKSTPIPQTRDAVFQWMTNAQEWQFIPESAAAIVYDFSSPTLLLENFRTGPASSWTQVNDGVRSNQGLLFVSNPYLDYAISVHATLSNASGGTPTAGGYGVLFNSSVTIDRDTGYALQFDRGYGNGTILIRRRILGIEGNPIVRVDHTNDPLIPVSRSDPWWTQEHELRLEVRSVAGTADQKQLDVWIDGTKLALTFTFTSSQTLDNNYTGFRSWSAPTVYRDLVITPL